MTERLLQRCAVCLSEPGVLTLQGVCKVTAHLVIAECIVPFSPQILFCFEVIVIHEAAAAEVLFKELLLLIIRICYYS